MVIDVNTLFPWWLVAALFVAFAVLTVVVYRKHELSRPWNTVLPGLRIFAIALILVMLKQPQLVDISEVDEKGRVAILVDNSGSMSVRDDFPPAKQVELAAQLGLFPADRRNNDFAAEEDNLESAHNHLRRINRRLYTLIQAIDRRNQQEIDQLTKDILTFLDAATTLLTPMPERLRTSIGAYTYLDKYTETEAVDDVRSRVHGLTFKRWEGINGWELSALTESEKFSREPDATQLVPNFDALQNSGSNLGVVLHGYIHPPTSGNYVFHIASDDQGALFLSTDRKPDNKQRICWVRNWTPRQKYTVYPEQKSKPIRLEAHKVYYVEAQMKELLGDDHLTVAWTRPDGTFESPIPGEYLSPYGVRIADFIGPDFDRLYPQVLSMTRNVSDMTLQLKAGFPRALSETQRARIADALDKHRQEVLNVATYITDLQREMRKLQEAADLRLAMSNQQAVNHALIRLRKMSRADLAREILTGPAFNLLGALEEQADPQLYVMGDQAQLITASELPVLKNRINRTDLGRNIRDLFRFYQDQYLAGIVVLSDGNDNSGSDLREIRQIAKERDIPLISLGIGSTRPPRDIAVEGVLAPESGFKNDQTLVTAVIKRDGYTGESIAVSVISDGKTLVRKIIPPGLESRVTVDLPFIESRSGSLEYSVSAQFFEGEQVQSNNRRLFKMTILKDPINVMLIDSFPRWESRYLTMMIQGDKRFTVTPVYCGLDSDKETPLPLNESLYSYQVLVLGDVKPDRFTGDQFEIIRTFVADHNGSVFLLAGPNFMPSSYLNTPLRDLLPLSAAGPSDKAALPSAFHPALDDDSGFDPAVRIASSPEMSLKLWTNLPKLSWVKTGIVGSRSSEVLVTTSKKEWPVIIRASNDIGRVIYIGSDSFWRWRDRAEWRYYHRFWGQLLLWAALDRSRSSNKYVSLMASRPEINPGESLDVTVKILDTDGQPLNDTRATLDVFDMASGNVVKIVELQYIDNSEGQYVATVKGLPMGKYRATPHIQKLDGLEATAELRFEIRDQPGTEFMDLAMNRPKLSRLSTTFFEFKDANKVLDAIPEVRVSRKHRREWSVWDVWPALLLIGVILAAEWFLRKRLQLP